MKQLREAGASRFVVTVLSMIGAAGFSSSIGGFGLWWSIVVGASLALGVSLLLANRAVHSTEWVLISLIAVLVLGPILVLGRPTPDGFATFFDGVFNGWAAVLTSTPRVPASAAVPIPPYFLSWGATTASLVIVSRFRYPALGAIPALIAFGVSMLFGGTFGTLSLILAVLLVVGTLAFGWRQQQQSIASQDVRIGNTTALVRRGRAVHSLGIVLAIAVIAPVVGSVLPVIDDTRYDLRDRLTPPWEPLDEPSPLAQVKRNLLPENREAVVFSASGSELPDRWAIATLANYNGFVWTVGDSENEQGAADFQPVDLSVVPDPALDSEEIDEETLIEVTVEIPPQSDADSIDLGVWVPLPGRPVEVTAVDQNGDPADIRVSAVTGTVAIPEGSSGHTVTALVDPFDAADAESMFAVAGFDGSAPSVSESSGFRTALGRLAQRTSCDLGDASCTPQPCAGSSWAVVQCVQDNLQIGGYSAEVGEAQAAPGHSLGRLEVVAVDREPEQYVGFEEQYGALAGLATRRAGVQSRVVVGYIAETSTESSIEFVAESVDVWLEVLTAEAGWVAVDVTPDRENEPQFDDPGRSTQPITDQIPPVPPPPPAVVENPQVPDEEELEEEDDDEAEEEPIADWVIAGGISLATPLLIGASWLAVLTLLKARRSRRRRNLPDPSHQVAGAWYESLDRLSEAGYSPEEGLTPIEFANQVDQRFDGATEMRDLAAVVDAAAFGPASLDQQDAEFAWERSKRITATVNGETNFLTGLRRKADPSPLLRRDPLVGATQVAGQFTDEFQGDDK